MSAPTSSEPPGAPHPEVGDVDALERDLDQNEARLLAELERRQVGKGRVSISDSGTKANPEAPSRKSADSDDLPREEALESRSAANGRACDLPCRAFASMQRAANGICSITGSTDARCARANERVRDSAARIADAGCACQPTP